MRELKLHYSFLFPLSFCKCMCISMFVFVYSFQVRFCWERGDVQCSCEFFFCWFLIHILVVWKWLCDNPNGKKYHNHILYNNMTAAVLVLCWCIVWWSKVSFLLPYISFVMALMPMIIMGNRNHRQQRHLRVKEGTWNHIAVIRSPW